MEPEAVDGELNHGDTFIMMTDSIITTLGESQSKKIMNQKTLSVSDLSKTLVDQATLINSKLEYGVMVVEKVS